FFSRLPCFPKGPIHVAPVAVVDRLHFHGTRLRSSWVQRIEHLETFRPSARAASRRDVSRRTGQLHWPPTIGEESVRGEQLFPLSHDRRCRWFSHVPRRTRWAWWPRRSRWAGDWWARWPRRTGWSRWSRRFPTSAGHERTRPRQGGQGPR